MFGMRSTDRGDPVRRRNEVIVGQRNDVAARRGQTGGDQLWDRCLIVHLDRSNNGSCAGDPFSRGTPRGHDDLHERV
jgi:hypothetical protein